MRCTDCNRPVKPVVAVDVDGTLGDWHHHWFRFAADWLGVDREKLSQWDCYDGSTDIATWMDIDKHTYRTMKLAFRQGGFKRWMPSFSGAHTVIRSLRGLGAVVWITTTRPYLRLDNVDPDTREWLERHGINYDGLIYDEDKYKVLIDIVGSERIVGVVDDLPANCERAKVLGLYPIQLATTYNRAVLQPVHVATLQSAGRQLAARIEQWREQHG